MDQRLKAAGDLAGPTALTQLSTAANPFVGKTENSTSNLTGFSNMLTQGQQDTTSSSNQLANTVSRGSESSAGSTTGSASQVGVGQIPQGQPVQTGGGCVLCTAAIELGLSKHHKVLRKVIQHKLQVDSKRFSRAARGYFAVFTPLAAWLLDHPRIAQVLFPVAKAVVYEELRVAGRKLPFKLWPAVVHWIGHYFCEGVDRTFSLKGYVSDERILTIARRENILYRLQEGAS